MKKIVIKIGTGVLTANNREIDNFFLEDFSKITKHLMEKYSVVIITSGAIATGLKIIGKERKNISLSEKQAAASCGQVVLMEKYKEYFNKQGMNVSQILLTNDDLSDLKRFRNIKATIDELMKRKIVPVINENDTVATDEIKVGDNDVLSARIAIKILAESLILVTDVEGLYDKNPTKYKDAKIINRIENITKEIERNASGSDSKDGTGGMRTKILAAKICMGSSVGMYIISKNKIDQINNMLNGESIGTFFVPGIKKTSQKKNWLAFCSKSKGEIFIDEGAVNALVNKNKSLLPAGINNIKGNFLVGDAVDIKNSSGQIIAKGISNFSSVDLLKIKGKNSEDIKKILPDFKKFEAIHKDNLTIIMAEEIKQPGI